MPKTKDNNSTKLARYEVPVGYRAASDKDVIRKLKYIRDHAIACALDCCVVADDGTKTIGGQYATAADLLSKTQMELERAYRITELAKGNDPDSKKVKVELSFKVANGSVTVDDIPKGKPRGNG